MIARRHRHGEAWKQIGITDEGEPMYALRWQDWLLIGITTGAGIALWAWFIAWCVS